MVDNDLYIFLESDRSACDDVLTKNYRRLARSFHPDKNPGSGEKFKEISNAYRILSDPIRRRMYDCYGVEYLKQPHMFREEEEEFRGMQPANDDIEVLELSSDSSENESESENQVRNERRGGTKRKNQAGRKPLSVKIDENENRMTPKEVERIAREYCCRSNFDSIVKIGDWYGHTRFQFSISKLNCAASKEAKPELICILCRTLFPHRPDWSSASNKSNLRSHAKRHHGKIYHEKPC